MLTYLQAVVIGLMQGITEMFPISSLGHSVLVPAWIGGSWAHFAHSESRGESPYLAFIVVLHVATALALLVFFWREWVAIVIGLFRSIARRRVETVHERMAWLLVVATIPAGLTGLLLEHAFRVLFAKPLAAAVFLTLNGVLLLGGERLRQRSDSQRPEATQESVGRERGQDAPDAAPRADVAVDERVVTRVRPRDAGVIGVAQILALLAGFSRSGVTMVAGLLRGLDHEEAVRFAFLLATPIILAAGVLKIPDFTGPLGNGIRAQAFVGAVVAFVAALATTKFLTTYFEKATRRLTPFGIYCLAFGAASIVRFA
jgi:undecaprenyl-diphosphatase